MAFEVFPMTRRVSLEITVQAREFHTIRVGTDVLILDELEASAYSDAGRFLVQYPEPTDDPNKVTVRRVALTESILELATVRA